MAIGSAVAVLERLGRRLPEIRRNDNTSPASLKPW
jgi:hypothetical protein